MRKLLSLYVFVLAVIVAGVALAGDFKVLTVTATNGNSVVSSQLPDTNAQYSVQCSNGNARYKLCATSSCTASTTDWLIPSAGMDLPVTTDNANPPAQARYVAVYADGADTTCQFYRVRPATLPGLN